jgi:hypothetical protein
MLVHKASGPTAAVVQRMLAAAKASEAVREKLLEYVIEKSAGLYRHRVLEMAIAAIAYLLNPASKKHI